MSDQTPQAPTSLDPATQRATDVVLQDEIVRNERWIIHPGLGRIRLSRPTPRKERQIAEIRRAQYHRDLQDASILSQSQLESIAIQRGMWSTEKAERLSVLSREVGELMGRLDLVGYQSVDQAIEDYYRVVGELTEQFEGTEERGWVTQYFNLDTEQDRTLRGKILRAASSTTVDDLLVQGDLLRTQITLLHDLARARKEMNDLQVQQTRLFVDSIESRSDRAEQLAQLYYCASREDGSPLWPKFEEIMDQEPEDIEYLMNEMFYFVNGITEEFKAILGKHGFIRRETTIDTSSDDSPALPLTSSAGESPESAPESSSE